MIGFWLGRASVGRPSHRAGPLGILASGILAYAIIRALGPWAWGISLAMLTLLAVAYVRHLRELSLARSRPVQRGTLKPQRTTAVRCWNCGGPDGEGRCRWCGARSV